MLVRGIEKSGSLLVKGAQYLSHRKDIIEQEVIDKMALLREQAPIHSFQDTL